MDILSAKIAGQDEENKNVQQQLKEIVRSLYYTGLLFKFVEVYHLIYLTIIHVKSPQQGKTAKQELLTKTKQIKALESKVKKKKYKNHIVTCKTYALFTIVFKHVFKLILFCFFFS